MTNYCKRPIAQHRYIFFTEQNLSNGKCYCVQALEAKHKKMKTLHYQTQKEQKNLEERLSQEEVSKKLIVNWCQAGAVSIECHKTKTKVITLANHKTHRQSSEPIKTRIKYM